MRGMCAALAVLPLASAPSPLRAEPPTYMIRVVGTLGGESRAQRMSDAGHIAGFSGIEESIFSPQHPFIVREGEMVDIVPHEGTEFSHIWDVNNLGHVLFRTFGTGSDIFISYPDGTFARPRELMEVPADAPVELAAATAMNDMGQFAGHVRREIPPTQGANVHRIALWDADWGYHELGALEPPVPNWPLIARAMNNVPQVVGQCPVDVPGAPFSGFDHAFVSDGDRLIDLHPMDRHPNAESYAYDISENGWIAGYMDDLDRPQDIVKWAVRWTPEGEFERLPRYDYEPFGREEAYGVNSDGWCVGFSQNVSAILWDLEAAYVLQDRIIDPEGRWNFLAEATDINDSGRIVGFGGYQLRPDAGVLRAFELIPCWADANRDKAVDLDDFVAFRQQFLAGSTDADLNRDGRLDVADFSEFVRVFRLGCQ